MKIVSRLLVSLALLATSSLALAQHNDHGHDRRGQNHAGRDHRQGSRHVEHRHAEPRHRAHRSPMAPRYSGHHDYRRVEHHDYRRYGYRPVPRHAHRRWVRGHRYNGPMYVVRNYGYYRLRPPPRGYRWVRADNEFLLVAIGTGIILDLALR